MLAEIVPTDFFCALSIIRKSSSCLKAASAWFLPAGFAAARAAVNLVTSVSESVIKIWILLSILVSAPISLIKFPTILSICNLILSR